MKQTLKIKDFEVWVHLGCAIEEQKHSQPVEFTLNIEFSKNLAGYHTDSLHDAVDYVRLTEVMKSVASRKNYKLIEHLNYEVFTALIADIKTKDVSGEIALTIRKVRVPVENLRSGVEFTCQQTL
ncbi:MAG: FolB domain-containing protein [Bdellovibrio sp.]|nr:FolB domain-containing protein [Bdellovibrio sp.]